jgi:hypothetical protein
MNGESTSEPWFVEFVEPGAKPEVLSTVLVLKKREPRDCVI